MNQPVSKWVNTEPDAGLPHALLEGLARSVPSTTIEDIWLFPTRRIATGESTVFVVAAVADEPDRRRVITARYLVTRDRKGTASVQEKIAEHGTAPTAAVARIVHGVLQRMGEEGEQPPRAVPVERDPERWWALIEELGGRRPEAVPEPDQSAQASDPAVAGSAAADASDAAAGDVANGPDGGPADQVSSTDNTGPEAPPPA